MFTERLDEHTDAFAHLQALDSGMRLVAQPDGAAGIALMKSMKARRGAGTSRRPG